MHIEFHQIKNMKNENKKHEAKTQQQQQQQHEKKCFNAIIEIG